MPFKHLLGLAVLATVATLTSCAPTDKVVSEPVKEETTAEIKDATKTTAEVNEVTVEEKEVSAEAKDSTNDVKEKSSEMKETTADVPKESVAAVMETEEVKALDMSKETEKKGDKEEEKIVKDVSVPTAGENSPLVITDKDKLTLQDVIETVKEKEKTLVELEKQLKDAVAETTTHSSSSKPGETESPTKKVSDIISQFLNELVQIPMVFLHAVSNAISTFTGNRLAVSLNKSPRLTPQLPALSE